jgi:chromosome segregation ATPase
MTDETQQTGQQPAEAEKTGQEQTVPYARFSEVISERNTLRQKLEAQEAERKALAERQLADQQEWQKLAEQRAQRIAELEPLANRVAEVQEALQATVEARVGRLPEDTRSLVPDYDDPRKTLAWLDANEERLLRPIAPSTDAGTRGDGGSAAKLTETELYIASKLGLKSEEFAAEKQRRPRLP